MQTGHKKLQVSFRWLFPFFPIPISHETSDAQNLPVILLMFHTQPEECYKINDMRLSLFYHCYLVGRTASPSEIRQKYSDRKHEKKCTDQTRRPGAPGSVIVRISKTKGMQ